VNKSETLYFWWSIVAVVGAAALALYAFMAFAIGGDEAPIQIGFALSLVKLALLIVGAVQVASSKKVYLSSTLIASIILPSFYFGQIAYSRSSPFSYKWSFGDDLLATLVVIDLVEILLTGLRLFQLRTTR
jgi:hypothetical protein